MMLARVCLLTLIAIGGASAAATQCQAGFNATLAGLPFYSWDTANCSTVGTQNCFGQQFSFVFAGLDVKIRFGGCVASAVSSQFTCESLFGPDSTYDPAALLAFIPQIQREFESFVQVFGADVSGKIQQLLSNGQSTDEFIAGSMVLLRNFGFQTTELQKLQPQIANLFASVFKNNSIQQAAVNEFIGALGNLSTVTNTKFSADLSTFFTNIGIMLPNELAPLRDNLPGLVRSLLNDNWNIKEYYDLIFPVLADVNPANFTKTVEDIIQTINATLKIPASYNLNPLLDSLPVLVGQLVAGNTNYTNTWSLNLLKSYSEKNAVTMALSNAVTNFLASLGIMVPSEFQVIVDYIPGYFYTYFPSQKSEINDAYEKITAAINSINISNPGVTAAETEMSKFILSILNKTGTNLPAFARPIIINLSKLFYDLLPNYQTYLDTFFTTVSANFQNFPQFDVGATITSLIVNFNETVPAEVKPLLDNVQAVINGAIQSPFNASTLFAAFETVINAYKSQFPNSPIPDIIQRYVNYIKQVISPTTTPQQQLQLALDAQLIGIDLSFAIFNATSSSPLFTNLTNELLKAFPQYSIYIKLMSQLDPEDVKQLVRDIFTWAASASSTNQLTTEGFVAAINGTIYKITSTIRDAIKDIRSLVAPESCRYNTCDQNTCNTQTFISDITPVTKPKTTTPVTNVQTTGNVIVTAQETTTTTAGGSNCLPSTSLLILILAMMTRNLIFG